MTPGEGGLEVGPPDIGGSFHVVFPRPLPMSGATCGTGEPAPAGPQYRGGGAAFRGTGGFLRPQIHPVSREWGAHPGTV